jgi:integrase
VLFKGVISTRIQHTFPGLYLRRQVWWLRWTPAPGLEQQRVSLGTRDYEQAVVLAIQTKRKAVNAARELMEGCTAEIEAYLAHCRRQGLSKATVEQRKYALQGFTDFCEAASPATISPAKSLRWFEARADQNAHTADAYLVIVRWWFAWLMERGKLRADPTAAIKPPKLPMKTRKVFLSFERARRFLDECREVEGPKTRAATEDPRERMSMLDLKLVIYLGLQHGMRKLEIIEARPEWFDLDAGLIHITRTATFVPKGRHNRTVPMTEEFRAWLRDVYGLRGPFVLMPNVEHGSYRYRFDFRTKYENYVATLGDDITFHDLRRTFGSLLVSRGVSLYKVAKWLGDTLKVAESTYGHLVAQDDEINAAWV